MIESIRNRTPTNLQQIAGANSDGRSINRRASLSSLQPPRDVMERSAAAAPAGKAQALTATADTGNALASVGNILQGLLGDAGGVVSAVADGLKGLIDAGTGFLGIVGNALSRFIGLLG